MFMKKIYRPFIKGTNWALAGLLSFFGFSGCDGPGGMMMYGVPWASCAIEGNVIDKATKQPIPGIEVKIVLPDNINLSPPKPDSWTRTTDNDGKFKLSDTLQSDSIPLVATDIDGELNGLYKPDTIYVNFSKAQHIGGGKGWFQGELVATANFELEARETDE